MKLKRKIGAKLNLTLDVLGQKNGYHQLKSLVAELDLCDEIIVKKRKDKQICLNIVGADLPTDEKNNAFRACKLFMEEFSTSGVDVTIIKNIPIGGGLGGSSADVAGVLLLMKKLFKVDSDLKNISSKLGSDVYYMLFGGYALMSGKGEELKKVNCFTTLYLLLATCDKSVSALESYTEFDRQAIYYPPCTDQTVSYLLNENFPAMLSTMKNDLSCASTTLVPKIHDNLKTLSICGNAFMTGSGSVTYSVFTSKKERNYWYKKLKTQLNLIKAQTII